MMDKLAMSPDHVFGTQRKLFDRSAIGVQAMNAFEGQTDRGR